MFDGVEDLLGGGSSAGGGCGWLLPGREVGVDALDVLPPVDSSVDSSIDSSGVLLCGVELREIGGGATGSG